MIKIKSILLFLTSIIFISSCSENLNPLNVTSISIPQPDENTIVFTYPKQMWNVALSFYPYTEIYNISSGFLDGESSWSPDKKNIAYIRDFGTQNKQIWKMRYDGSNKTQLTRNDMNCSSPSYSYDGKKIVYIVETVQKSDIYIMDTTGFNFRQITNSKNIPFYDVGVRTGYPNLSPDGKKIIFSYYRKDNMESDLAIINIEDNSFTPLGFTGTYDVAYMASWSPNGNEIIFLNSITDQEGSKIFRMDSNGTNIVQLTDSFGSYNPKWNHDGSMIVYQNIENPSDDYSIWTMNRDGTNKKKVINTIGAQEPDW